MACRIGHARTSQADLPNQVQISSYYTGSWNCVLRPKTRDIAEKIATAMTNACNNQNIGYSQNDRLSLWYQLKRLAGESWTPELMNQVNQRCNCDCSSLVHMCCNCAGMWISLIDGNATVTYNEREDLGRTGNFMIISDSKYTRQSTYLRRGDILLFIGRWQDRTGHTAIVIEDGDQAYDLDEYPQINDYTQSSQTQQQNTGIDKTKDNVPTPTIHKVIDSSTNNNDLENFKQDYWDMFGATFTWLSYNAPMTNGIEVANDYSALMVAHILDNNGSCSDEIFNQWATARMIKMLNSDYNMNNALAIERILRLYESTEDNTVKDYIANQILGWDKTAIYGNENNFKSAYRQAYPDSNLDEFNETWNIKTKWTRPDYFPDVLQETLDGFSLASIQNTDVLIPSEINMKKFDRETFDGKLMQYLFKHFLQKYPKLLLWKYNSIAQRYSYLPEDEEKQGPLLADWQKMVDSKNVKYDLTNVDKESVIDVYNFTKDKDFALSATVNKLRDLDQTIKLVYNENGKYEEFIIQNKIYKTVDYNYNQTGDDVIVDENVEIFIPNDEQIDFYSLQMQQWDSLVKFKFYTHDYEYYFDNHWAFIVDEAPYNLLFWLEFLDTEGELSKFSVPAIGPRQKALTDSKVRAITYESVPNIIYVYDKNLQENFEVGEAEASSSSTGYTRLYLPYQYRSLFTVSTHGKTAKDVVDELLYNNTHALETLSITSLPIYYLDPNSRINIYDEQIGINHEYVLNKITLPLQYNGTMSLQASKTIDRLY